MPSIIISAAHNGVDCLNEMIRLGFDLDQADYFGMTALIAACKGPRRDWCLQKLLEKGASVNKADFEGKTPLIYAVLSN